VRPTLQSLSAGVYELELTVTDDQGATGKDRIIVTVSGGSGNNSPVAKAGDDQTIQLANARTELDGTGSTDADGSIQAYKWQQVAGPTTAVLGSADAAKTTVSALAAGTYEFELTVTDDKGAQATDRIVITVLDDKSNVEDTLCIYPVPVKTTMSVKISASAMGKSSIAIYSTTGHLAYRKEFMKTTPIQTETVDISRLQVGAYVVVVQIEDISRMMRMIWKR
jgi:hypothetical protein